MLTLAQATECEGYYLDTHSGDILRNVKAVPKSCNHDGASEEGGQEGSSNVPRFERLDENVTAPLETILKRAQVRFGRPLSGQIINRQTAMQPDSVVVTEKSEMH